MQLFDQCFTDGLLGIPEDQIDALEMIGGFHHIIDVDDTMFHADGIGFVDIPRLVVGQTASLNVVGIVGEIDLNFVVDPAFHVSGHLVLQNIEQGAGRLLLFVDALWTLCVLRNVPCLAGKNCPRNLAGSTVVTDRALGKIPCFCRISDRLIVHLNTSHEMIIPFYRQESK